jgi:hypothetical protein
MTSFCASALEHDAAGCECLKAVLASEHDGIEPFRPSSATTAVLGSSLVTAYHSAHGTEVKSPGPGLASCLLGCDPPGTALAQTT